MNISDAIELFVTAKRADGRKPRTIKGYYRCLPPFADWCTAQSLDTDNLTRWNFRTYVTEELQGRGWSEATEGIHIRNLRCFLRWLYTEGITEDNLADAVEAPGRSIRFEEPLSKDELRQLLEACDKGKYPIRDRAIIMTLVDTGLRRGEIAELRRDQLSIDGDVVCINRIDPKSQAPKPIFLGSTTTSLVLQYLEERTDDTPALWMGRNGPLTAEGIRQVVKRRAKNASLERVHPHLFRKTFATWWIRNGGDLDRLKTLGGWKTDEALQVYILLGKYEDLKEAHQEFGPVDNLLD
jgi:site-specific recombinase XerD